MNFKIIKEVKELVEIPLEDENGEIKKDADGNDLFEKVPVVKDIFFKFYNEKVFFMKKIRSRFYIPSLDYSLSVYTFFIFNFINKMSHNTINSKRKAQSAKL